MPRLSSICKFRICVVGGGSRGQVGPDILMVALCPDYCFLISLIGEPWIGGMENGGGVKDIPKTKA